MNVKQKVMSWILIRKMKQGIGRQAKRDMLSDGGWTERSLWWGSCSWDLKEEGGLHSNPQTLGSCCLRTLALAIPLAQRALSPDLSVFSSYSLKLPLPGFKCKFYKSRPLLITVPSSVNTCEWVNGPKLQSLCQPTHYMKLLLVLHPYKLQLL